MNKIPAMKLGLALAPFVLFAGAAKAELVSIAWDSADHFEKTVSVNPGKFAEVCGKLKKGELIAWSFKSSEPMNFNIHYHEGKKVIFPAKQDGVAAAEDKLAVALAQDYCWMWANKTDKAVELSFALQRL